MGNLEGYDSLISCFLLAVKDKIMDEPNPIKGIREFRANLGKYISPEVLIQENWSFANEEIIRDLQDADLAFDSQRFYRALEVRFGVNIFIFLLNGSLEIPNHRYFSARRFDLEKPSVVLIRIDEKRKREPTYHLVVSQEQGKDKEDIRSMGFKNYT